MKRLLAFYLLILAPTPALAVSHLGIADGRGQKCEHVDMRADDAVCDKTVCHLTGHAELRCDALLLHGDNIDIAIDDDRTFGGAVGFGNVVMVEGAKVIRCERVSLGADRVQGRVDAATIEVRRPGALIDALGVPQGRNAAIAHGTIERLDRDHIQLTDGDFTVCDCGAGQRPSWRLDTPHMDVTLGERAVIYWPQVNISPFGLFTMPLLPPLAPLSIPLKSRAMGFLPPLIQFLQFPWPTLDLPFFVPLGDSYDLTIIPGLRTDWGDHWHWLRDAYATGAPRIGARLRYAPVEGTFGTLQASWTHDAHHGMARSTLATERRSNPAAPVNDIDQARRTALVERVLIDWRHHTVFSPNVDWLVDARWLSDDLINQDFMVTAEERFAQYMPSRTQAMWRHPSGVGVLSADYMERLDNADAGGWVYSNTGGAEDSTLQRGPYMSLQLLPRPIAGGLHGDASVSFVRYGSWLGTTGTVASLGQGTLGAAYLDRVGPVNVAARAGVDSLLVTTARLPSFLDTALLLRADTDVRLVGRLGAFYHAITPRLSYRAMPAVWAPKWAVDQAVTFPDNRALTALGQPPVWPPQWAAMQMRSDLDERLLRRVVHQGMVSLGQSVWADAALPLGNLDVSLPIDLTTGMPLAPFAELSWRMAPNGSGMLWTSVDPARWSATPVREVGGRFDYALGPLSLVGQYLRLAPDADRFERSIYEMVAPRLPARAQQTTDHWAHMARGGLALRLGGFVLGYNGQYALPRPDVDPSFGEEACSQNGHPSTHCFTAHTVTLAYSSPCDCWGVNSTIAVDPTHPQSGWRFNVMFDVAGYRIGASPTKH